MAYNSDGYIMVDFTEVDFRQTNQYIEGLFDRLRKVIGTNKFVLVINANGKTPLPSTVSITNGQYVIESCIYTFSVNSFDILHISRHDPTNLIDDTVITDNKTWSSYKINAEIEAASGGGTLVSDILEAGETSITLSDASITADSWVKPFASVWGVMCTNMVVSTGSVALTFEAQASDINVGVEVL